MKLGVPTGKERLSWANRRAVPGFHVPEPRVHQVCGQVVFKGEMVAYPPHEDHQHGGISSVGQPGDMATKILIKVEANLPDLYIMGTLTTLYLSGRKCPFRVETGSKDQPFP